MTGALERAGHIPTIYPSPVDTRDPTKGIRAAFEAKLAADPAFAANADARLAWLTKRLPGRSRFHLTYPVLREP